MCATERAKLAIELEAFYTMNINSIARNVFRFSSVKYYILMRIKMMMQIIANAMNENDSPSTVFYAYRQKTSSASSDSRQFQKLIDKNCDIVHVHITCM